MKYIVSSAATLNLADGSKFDLVPGIHSAFPENIKEHWAFEAYVKPLGKDDLLKEQHSNDLALRVGALESEITDLKAQLENKAPAQESTPAAEAKVTDNAKKQSSTNK